MKPRPEWNVILRGGPHDGMMLFLPVDTTEIVEGGIGLMPVLGQYQRTDDSEDDRIMFRWAADETTGGGA